VGLFGRRLGGFLQFLPGLLQFGLGALRGFGHIVARFLCVCTLLFIRLVSVLQPPTTGAHRNRQNPRKAHYAPRTYGHLFLLESRRWGLGTIRCLDAATDIPGRPTIFTKS
jgi:hypothetical protein